MAIRKFVAPTTREAMIQVRRELGDDAVIIANRRAGNRIEILAAAPDAVEALVERSETRAAGPAREPAGNPRPKIEAFEDFVRRQMHAEVDAPPAPRAVRATPARPAPKDPAFGGNTRAAGVAMYHDVAGIEEEEFDAGAVPRETERARALARPARAQAATTLPQSHRALQIETAAPAADPAVFRRRPARVVHPVQLAPPIDIVLEPDPAAQLPAQPPAPVQATPAPQPVMPPPAPAPVVVADAVPEPGPEPIATGHAPVPSLPVRSQAAPIATAARLREASVQAAAERARAPQPVRAEPPATPAAQAPAPVVAAVPVAPAAAPVIETPVPSAAWSWDTPVEAAVAPSAPQPQQAPMAPAVPIVPVQSAPAPVEARLFAELQSMREVLREQIATLAAKPAPDAATPDSHATRVKTRLLTAGFSVEVARRIAAHAPRSGDAGQAEAWLHEVLAHNIRCAEAAHGIVERAGTPATPGQIFALVGPTGVGKTTTVAKLAARFAVRHGTSALGLVTLDSYRIAAPEQLRTYGRILGTPVHLAQDAPTLRELLATMVHKRLVLIDTCGVSQRDERLAEMLDLLAGAGTATRPIQRVLLLNSASHAETLDEAARAWRAQECAGAILTKLDEATRIGGALDVSLRHRLTLLGLTNGQRVPEDWHAANGRLLAHLVLKPAAQAFELADDEGAALMRVPAPYVAAHGAPHG